MRQKKIDKKSFITGIITNFIVSGIFFLLSITNNLLFTKIISGILFGTLIIIILKNKNIKTIIASIVFSLLILIASFFLEINFVNYNQKIISEKLIHLGDKELSWFDIAKPSDLKYVIIDFKLEKVPNKALIEITAKDVDPDFRNGPVGIFVNGQFVTYLNNIYPFSNILAAEEHTYGYAKGKITIPNGFLIEGNNELMIALVPSNYGYDDILISDVKLFWK